MISRDETWMKVISDQKNWNFLSYSAAEHSSQNTAQHIISDMPFV